MTTRATLFVAALLWSGLTLLNVAAAQENSASERDQVPIRASHHGEFLPAGTELIVLSRDGRLQRRDRYQPEFLSMSDFPRHGFGPTRKDRLGEDGRSVGTYARTQATGRLYFIYALAPDSTLYGSYSAQRDSLKFDVVHSGVMSVAPITADEIRGEVLASFFRRRVTVLMPSDFMATEPASDSEPGSPGRDSSRMQIGALPHSMNVEGARVEYGAHPGVDHADQRVQAGEEHAVVERGDDGNAVEERGRQIASDRGEFVPRKDSSTAARTPVVAAGAQMRSTAGPFDSMPPLFIFLVLAVIAAAAAVPAYIARNYRRELKRARLELVALRSKSTAGDIETSVQQRLEDAERHTEQMEEKYESLLHHYLALKRERESQRA